MGRKMNSTKATDNGSPKIGMTKTTHWLLNTALVFAIIVGMKSMAPMLTQVLIILFISIVISPVYYGLRRLKFPSWLAVTLMIVVMALLFLYGINIAFFRAFIEFTKDIPRYRDELDTGIKDLVLWLHGQGLEVSYETLSAFVAVDLSTLQELMRSATTRVTSFLKDSVFVLIIVSFIIVELPSLPSKAKSLHWMTPALWNKLSKIVLDVRHYMTIKTWISTATGICIYVGLLFLGVDSPMLLGITAFVLNFVPVIGSIIAAFPAILIAVLQYNVLKGFYVALLYLAVNTLFGNILEPRLMGYGFGVSPVVVLVSLIFWGWVLGPVGMFFAVPLTMALRGSIESMLRETMKDY